MAGKGKRKERACRQVGDKETQDVWPIPIAYQTAGLLVVYPCIPAIAPYLTARLYGWLPLSDAYGIPLGGRGLLTMGLCIDCFSDSKDKKDSKDSPFCP